MIPVLTVGVLSNRHRLPSQQLGKEVPQDRNPGASTSTRGRGTGTRSGLAAPQASRADRSSGSRGLAGGGRGSTAPTRAPPRPPAGPPDPAPPLPHRPRGPAAARTLPAGPGPARPWGPPPSAMGAADFPGSAAPARGRPAERKQSGRGHFRRRGQLGRVGGAASGERAPPSRASGAQRGAPAPPPPASRPDARPTQRAPAPAPALSRAARRQGARRRARQRGGLYTRVEESGKTSSHGGRSPTHSHELWLAGLVPAPGEGRGLPHHRGTARSREGGFRGVCARQCPAPEQRRAGRAGMRRGPASGSVPRSGFCWPRAAAGECAPRIL